MKDFLSELPSLKAKDGKAPWLANVKHRFVLGKHSFMKRKSCRAIRLATRVSFIIMTLLNCVYVHFVCGRC